MLAVEKPGGVCFRERGRTTPQDVSPLQKASAPSLYLVPESGASVLDGVRCARLKSHGKGERSSETPVL